MKYHIKYTVDMFTSEGATIEDIFNIVRAARDVQFSSYLPTDIKLTSVAKNFDVLDESGKSIIIDKDNPPADEFGSWVAQKTNG